MSIRYTILAAVFGLCFNVPDSVCAQGRPGGAVASSALFQTMQATGKPALIIAGSTGCVYCVEMSEELQSNPKLQPFVQNMFVVKIDVASRDWPILRDTFKFEESGIPAVFFVRADGELLYSDAGKPSDMEGFLKRQMDKSGVLLDAKTLRLLTRDAKQLDLALKRKDFDKAATLIKEHAGSGSYAAAALAFDRAGSQLTEEAKALSQAAVAKLTQRDESVEAALELMDLETTFAPLEPAQKIIAEALTTASEDPTTKDLLAAAKKLQPARAAESTRRWKEAVDG